MDWTACDEDLQAQFPGLRSRMQCARIEVPLDHQTPAGGTLLLDVLRVRAGDPTARRGNLFVSPGGPGVPAFFFTASLAETWEGDFMPSPDKRRISERHDLIAVQQRGVAGSPLLDCKSDAILHPYADITDDRSEVNLAAINLHAATVAQGCQSQPQSRYVNVDQMARDMEAVRQRLGGEPLNYWGVSWGTELGAWYGALFPQHVDRMILDSNVDWTRDLYHSWIAQGPARQEIFERFVVDQVIRSPQAWGLGSSAADVFARFAGFLPTSRQIVRSLFESPDVMVAVDFLDRTLRSNPALTEPALASLARTHRYSMDERIDTAARRWATLVLPSYFSPPAGPTRLELPPTVSVFHTASCQSSAAMPPPGFWDALGDDAARNSPIGGSHNSYEPCAYWTAATSVRPDMRRLAGISNLVMLQAEYDWRTPRQGAIDAHAKVRGASLVLAQGVQTHGFAYNGSSACMDRVAGRFMADGIKPGRMHLCSDSETHRLHSAPSYLELLRQHTGSHSDVPFF